MTETLRITAPEPVVVQPPSRFERLLPVRGISLGRWSAGSPLPYLVLLVVIWFALLALLLLLQVLGTGLGFRVWPMGEDRSLVHLMMFNDLPDVPRAWFQWLQRNPLTPYWWMAAKPLVLDFTYGIYLVRKLVDIFCALSVFLLLFQLGKGRYPLFAFSCALLTLLWTFDGRFEQSIWPYVAVLGLSVLSLWAYCRFLDSGRGTPYYLVLSVLLYFLSVATYTLQVSALLAIPVLAIARYGGAGPMVAWRWRVALAALDTAFYGAALGLFFAMWFATRSGSHDQYFTLSATGFQENAWLSLRLLLWHTDYTTLARSVAANWGPLLPLFTALVSFLAFAALFWRVGLNRPVLTSSQSPPSPGVGPGTYQPSLLATIGQAVAVATALALGSIFVESLASEVWPPGHRSRMVQQVFQPLLYGSGVFAIALLAERFRPRLGRFVAIGGMAALCALALVGTLEYNRRLNEDTSRDQRLIAGLQAMLPDTNRPVTIVVIPPDTGLPKWNNYLSDEYVQTEFASPYVFARVLHPGPPVTAWTDYDSVVFSTDNEGAYLVTEGMVPKWFPYDDLLFVRYDGESVTRLDRISADDVSGFRVAFLRDDPIATSLDPQTLADCPSDLDFDRAASGVGWSVPEVAPDGTTFIWTTATNSTLDLGMAVDRAFEVEARVFLAMAPDILESVQFSVNEQPVPTEVTTGPDGATVVRATVPESVLHNVMTTASPVILVATGETTELGISINRTVVPEGGDRTLGIAFDAMRFDCAGDAPLAAAASPMPSLPSESGRQPAAPPATGAPAAADPGATPLPQVVAMPATSLQCPPQRDSPESVAGTPCLTADPNPVPVVGGFGRTTIAWSVGDVPRGSTGQVYVAKDGRPEIFFLDGRRGTSTARIRAGSVYEFRLYAGPERVEPVATVIVGTTGE